MELMSDPKTLIIIILLGLCGFLLYWIKRLVDQLSLNKESLSSAQYQIQDNDKLKEQLEKLESQRIDLEKALSETQTRLEVAQVGFSEERERLNQFKELSKTEFENLAHKIFEDRSTKFKQHSEEGLSQILGPLKSKIEEFQKQVGETYQGESRERFALKQEIEKLVEASQKMEKETSDLTRALKGDSKLQGNWGEIVLLRILESAGLREGEEFTTQGRDLGLKDDQGIRQMPDVIIHLPDGKHLIIDSKVSLTHYEQLINCTEDDQREKWEKLFLNSLQSHVKDLSQKKYQHNEKLVSPDFVFMFFPIEGAFHQALQLDSTLFQKSWERSIVIVGPTTLLAVLKTVDALWKQDRQNKNALKIAAECGRLYDKMVGFVEDLDKVGDQIDRAHDTWSKAQEKLYTGKGNVLSRFEKIKSLGARAAKTMPLQENITNSHSELATKEDDSLQQGSDV